MEAGHCGDAEGWVRERSGAVTRAVLLDAIYTEK